MQLKTSAVLHPWIPPTTGCGVLEYILREKKNLHISGPAQFKCVFKG